MTIHPFVRRLVTVYSAGLILMFFSEFYFLNEGPVLNLLDGLTGDPLQLVFTFAEFGLYYALFAYVFYIVLARYDVRTLMGLLLAGAIFGWATEGVIIPLVYEAVPFSFIFPSVAWHAVVDVLIGWYALRLLMRRNNLLLSAGVFVILGAAWGGWATWFWGEPGELAPVPPDEFTAYVFVTAAVWIIGLVALDRFDTVAFTPNRWETRIVIGFSILMAILIAIPFMPFSLLLPPLVWWTLAALKRQPLDAVDKVRAPLAAPPGLWQYPLGLLMPLTAALVYPLFYDAGTGIPTEDVLFLLFTGSFIAFMVALIRPFWRQRA